MRMFRRNAGSRETADSDRAPLRLAKNASARLDDEGSGLNPLAVSLLRFWYAHRLDTGLPDRRTFDPAGMATWLGYISIYEYIPEREDFRNRLEGSFTVDKTGENWTGRYASEVDSKFGSRFLAELLETRSQRAPRIDLIQIFQNDFGVAERLLLPVSRIGSDEADQVFVAIFASASQATVMA